MYRKMSGSVGSVISESGMVENVGVAAGTGLPALSGQKLVPLSVLVSDIQGGCSRCRPMSGRVGSVIYESGIVANVG